MGNKLHGMPLKSEWEIWVNISEVVLRNGKDQEAALEGQLRLMDGKRP